MALVLIEKKRTKPTAGRCIYRGRGPLVHYADPQITDWGGGGGGAVVEAQSGMSGK